MKNITKEEMKTLIKAEYILKDIFESMTNEEKDNFYTDAGIYFSDLIIGLKCLKIN